MDLNTVKQSDITSIRLRYRDYVSSFLEENKFHPDYFDSYDTTRLNIDLLVGDANRYALFETKSEYPGLFLQSGAGVNNPCSFYAGEFTYQYLKRREEQHRRTVVKKRWKRINH